MFTDPGQGIHREDHPLSVKNISLLGSTGSIGVNTLDVIERHPDRFRLVALAAGRNLNLLEQQVWKFRPELVAIHDTSSYAQLKKALSGIKVEIVAGMEGVVAVASWQAADLVVSAIVGAAGLEPGLAAIRAGKDIALANKESLVMAGELFMKEIALAGVGLLPVDSEHSAIFQALYNGSSRKAGRLVLANRGEVDRLILTASGGPFRGWKWKDLQSVTPEQALAHPNWNMGKKITIDSATLMNKGLEVIEAFFLFGFPPGRIDVIVHPESIVHSMVSYRDGSVLAQLGVPDMRTPIAVAMAWPDRIETGVAALDLVGRGSLNFFGPPDNRDFPCLGLAYEALAQGGGAPAVLNAANEVAVAAFLAGELGFTRIPEVIEWSLTHGEKIPVPATLAEVIELDRVTRTRVRERFFPTGMVVGGSC
ncbi:MAG: 1-deoxy-D-xylulose-5-phosphate reductoisomerase [Magnetococcales bacterium]|nr:1-deoxy-D-xylulose-5-phosphate reductoisomerase [Magnetococcales bacterium]